MIEWLGRKEAYHNLYSQCLAIKLAVEVDETAGGAVPRAGSILDSSSSLILAGQYLAQFRAPLVERNRSCLQDLQFTQAPDQHAFYRLSPPIRPSWCSLIERNPPSNARS